MTKEVEYTLTDLMSHIPSRTLIAVIRLGNGLTEGIIYHFDDIRDAISSILQYQREGRAPQSVMLSIPNGTSTAHIKSKVGPVKMNELFEDEDVQYACSRSCELTIKTQQDQLESSNSSLSSAAIMVTLEFLNIAEDTRNYADICRDDVPFERADVFVEKIHAVLKRFGGPIFALSELKRQIKSGRVFKFFVEFCRIEDCKLFLQASGNIEGPIISDENVQITFEGVNLYDVDRESLFFSQNLQKHSTESEEVLDTPIRDTVFPSSLTLACDSSTSTSFDIDLKKIECGFEQRTTCMIRNIPNKYTQQMIFDMVNETHRGCFDFLYLRMDFRNRCNVGYAFINFTSPKHIISFAERVHGRRWARFNSDKVCNLTFARIQGTLALVEKFRHSKVMFEAPAYRPKLFHTEGPLAGQEIPFPSPI